MPNWCSCTLKIKGKSNLRNDFKHAMDSFIKSKFAKFDTEENRANGFSYPSFDFEFILPMPEALRGTTSPRPMTKEAVIKLAKENNWDDSLLNARLACTPSDEEFAALDALKDEYGFDNWYDWSLANWDTKWNACHTEGCLPAETPKMLIYSFDTAWGSPDNVIHALAKRFPNLTFRLEYTLEGESGKFCLEGNGEYYRQSKTSKC